MWNRIQWTGVQFCEDPYTLFQRVTFYLFYEMTRKLEFKPTISCKQLALKVVFF